MRIKMYKIQLVSFNADWKFQILFYAHLKHLYSSFILYSRDGPISLMLCKYRVERIFIYFFFREESAKGNNKRSLIRVVSQSTTINFFSSHHQARKIQHRNMKCMKFPFWWCFLLWLMLRYETPFTLPEELVRVKHCLAHLRRERRVKWCDAAVKVFLCVVYE